MIEKLILVDKKNIPVLEKNFIVINKMEIKNRDNLLIGLLYHGGCKKHFFRLFGFFEDNRILSLLLDHDSNDDQCKMIVREDLLFDLSVVRDNYIVQNNIQNNYLILKLEKLNVKYYFD